ncbi:ribosome maturation factor RimM [Bacillus horti]|uniref:Ribosome maturation factor RimM n=1 Tax=Caldalkalibacillus horti TaxID=77523 RepID=A0ABT9W292_9BACI|nr:ribosome maturation factor RimM [Bacillus horti]MDQ0167358.1 16S rRNA processing protein RimM [Bacillus horti]
MNKLFKVGKIVNTHGIRGEVRVLTTSDFKEERYRKGNVLYIVKDVKSTEAASVTIESHRVHKNFDLLMFEGHPSINDVEKYKGSFLMVTEDDRVELTEGEYYYSDIIGCEVITEDGEALGKIKEIISTGANDVWVIQRYAQGKDILIPYIEDVVKDIQLANKTITIHVLEGLLE